MSKDGLRFSLGGFCSSPWNLKPVPPLILHQHSASSTTNYPSSTIVLKLYLFSTAKSWFWTSVSSFTKILIVFFWINFSHIWCIRFFNWDFTGRINLPAFYSVLFISKLGISEDTRCPVVNGYHHAQTHKFLLVFLSMFVLVIVEGLNIFGSYNWRTQHIVLEIFTKFPLIRSVFQKFILFFLRFFFI